MDNLLVALIARVPDLSDAAKITLCEIIVHRESGTKRIPSLKELARIRGKSKQSIQSHLKELEDAKIVELRGGGVGGKTKKQRRRKMFFDYDALARMLGFSSTKAIDYEAFLGSFHAVDVLEGKKSVRKSRIVSKAVSKWKPSDLLAYFDMKYKEIYEKTRKGVRTDLNIFRMMQKTYGAKKVRAMIDRYARGWKRMRLGAFRPSILYESKNRFDQLVGNV